MNILKIKKNLTAVILCGGKGQRLRPITNKIPKPLIKIKGEEILKYILKHILSYKINNFLVLCGYKKQNIQNFLNKKFKKIDYLDTGLNSDILGRIKKGKKYYNDYLLICYGDTLVDLNINSLIKKHIVTKSNLTISIYNPKINFGILDVDNKDNVRAFNEKPKLNNWINVGFILVKKSKFFQLSKKFNTFKSFLESLDKMEKIKAFKHKGNHITVNTLTELDEAKKNIKFFKK